MAKPKKKISTTKKMKKTADELAAARLVMITDGGHRISHFVNSTADCGAKRKGWKYGEQKDITCKLCQNVVEA